MAKSRDLGEANPPRIGFLEGELSAPDDFKAMGREEIEQLFGIGGVKPS